jgi:glyoxylase-like metal-dependent hydrolase (beta-lactamase superfamily II)
MKIADGLDVLELKAERLEGTTVFCATLIWNEKDVILVDTGIPGQLETIQNEMKKAGVDFEKLNKIIITHHDMDHIGSLSSLVKALGNKVEVLSHVGEQPYIQGEKMPIKMTKERIAELEEELKSMLEEKRNEIRNMRETLKCKVDILIEDGEELPYCGGIVVIHTPGHTPGHTCLYLKKYKALVTGDALNVKEGKLVGPNPKYTYNLKEATNSLKKLAKYDIQTILCFHGGVYTNEANKSIAELTNTKQ